jgi:serine/threonine protein kinase
VAIKALPDHFAHDPDRLARFEREAKTLAQLNQPNVAGIYGVEEHEGARYLVLEYVERRLCTAAPLLQPSLDDYPVGARQSRFPPDGCQHLSLPTRPDRSRDRRVCVRHRASGAIATSGGGDEEPFLSS